MSDNHMTHVTTPSHLSMLLHVAMFSRIMVIHLPKGAKISLVFVNPGDCKDQFGDFLCCVRVIHDFSHLFSRITNKNFYSNFRKSKPYQSIHKY